MYDFVAIVSAAQETSRRANEARPDSPVQPDPVRERGVRTALLRQRLGAELRRLAELIEPVPECRLPADPVPR